jgi:hypothetical protein
MYKTQMLVLSELDVKEMELVWIVCVTCSRLAKTKLAIEIKSSCLLQSNTPSVPNYLSFWIFLMHFFCYAPKHKYISRCIVN